MDKDVFDAISRREAEEKAALEAAMKPKTPAKRRKLEDLDLESELIGQYENVTALQESVLMDDSIPPSQRAQVAGQVTSTLGALIKLQEDLQRVEAFKLMESVLSDALKVLPKSTRDEFFTEYEMLARKAGLL